MNMFTGDLEPDLQIILSARTPVDATTATSVKIVGRRDGTIIFDRAATSVTAVGDTSVVTMAWVAGDTDTPGRITIEVEVVWPGARPQTFQPQGGVQVDRDFDYVP